MWVVRPPTVPRYLGQGHQKGGEERISEDISENTIQDSDEIYLDEIRVRLKIYLEMRRLISGK